jgi:hypothetical protein
MTKYSDSEPGFFSGSLVPFQRECDVFARQSLFMAADLVIEALQQTARVLKSAEELGKQVNGLTEKLADQHQDLRHGARLRVQELVQDSVEICAEMIHGLGKVIRTGLDEASEIRQHSEKLQDSLRESWQDLPNPFRTRTVQKSTRSKEPTIIPISIQDN